MINTTAFLRKCIILIIFVLGSSEVGNNHFKFSGV